MTDSIMTIRWVANCIKGLAPLTQQQQLKLTTRISLVSAQLLLDFLIDALLFLGLLR